MSLAPLLAGVDAPDAPWNALVVDHVSTAPGDTAKPFRRSQSV
ncbi:hypothetical protein ACFQH5_15125 [Halomonas salifodinae]|uniref:Uncharacterized protein n=1 Tax=Halomonas salifodinae TaxID=438745 RepID=A0ABW2F104_9GAMM